jgi:hypothetical protein
MQVLQGMRKIHYNVMRFRNSFELDEAEVLAGRFTSVSARHYVLNDPEKLSAKYIAAWANFGLELRKEQLRDIRNSSSQFLPNNN